MKWYDRLWLKGLMMFIFAVILYSNTANHDYAWDDAIVLTENTRVQKGLKDVPELFKNIKSNETQNRYGYRPISLLSFATDVHFFGMNPKASHRINIVYYAILCVIIYYFLHSLFPKFKWGNVLVTALFVAHPLHTEVVANIKSRDEILAMIFGLSGLLIYGKALVSSQVKLFVASGAFMLLAFLSKESAVTFCGVAFLLPWFVTETVGIKEYIKKCLPAAMFLLVLLLLRLFVYSDAVFESNDFQLYQKGIFHQDGFVGNPLYGATFADRLATAVFLVGYFVYRMIVSLPLLHDYSYNQFAVVNWSEPQVWLAGLFLIALMALMINGIRKRTEWGFGLAFFLITASIYLHLVQIAPDIFGERFTFVPSLGIAISLLSVYRIKLKPRVVSILLILCLIPLSAITRTRNRAWIDNATLLKTDLPNLENCVRANYNYALFLHRKYYDLPTEQQPSASMEILHYYERTLQLTDRLFNVYIDLGGAYMEFGHPDKAKKVFEMAIDKYPDLSIPYVQMGKYYMSFKNWGDAIPYFEKALENGAKNSDFHYLLAICQFNMEKHEAAIQTLLQGEKLGVSSSAYHSLIARLYVKLNRNQDAIKALERGLVIYPNDQGLNSELNILKSSNSSVH